MKRCVPKILYTDIDSFHLSPGYIMAETDTGIYLSKVIISNWTIKLDKFEEFNVATITVQN